MTLEFQPFFYYRVSQYILTSEAQRMYGMYEMGILATGFGEFEMKLTLFLLSFGMKAVLKNCIKKSKTRWKSGLGHEKKYNFLYCLTHAK